LFLPFQCTEYHYIFNLKFLIIYYRFPAFSMGPKKETKEASASAKKKDTPAAAATPTATASAKKTTKPAGSAATTTTTKVVTKERKEKVKSTALKAKQRVAR
jgi:cytoskeletal protein RodZ